MYISEELGHFVYIAMYISEESGHFLYIAMYISEVRPLCVYSHVY